MDTIKYVDPGRFIDCTRPKFHFQGVFSGVVISQDFLRLHNLEDPSKASLLGTVTAIYDVGCFLGSLAAYWLGERLGRRNTVLLGTIVMTVGALLQASSYSLGHMMAGRIIAGVGNGKP